jgi:FAD:protein FMN transferase
VLRQLGMTSALVSAGGSTLSALGHPPGRPAWRLGVRDPANPAASLRFVMLRDGAISTSGISDKFVDVNGRRYGHIIDPRTGEPVQGMCQASVIAPSATDSDALTKAAFILPRTAVTDVFRRRTGVHVIRIEGPCSHGVVWTTPWSNGIFERTTN